MILTSVFALAASLCLIPSLYHGAKQDLHEFKFSESHFKTDLIKIAFGFLALTYVCMFIDELSTMVAMMVGMSLIGWVVFSFIGFRFGNGGDWRAMMYIAAITPFLLFSSMIVIGICAMIQAIVWVARKDILVPPMFRKIPFALSILVGYVIAVVVFAITSIP